VAGWVQQGAKHTALILLTQRFPFSMNQKQSCTLFSLSNRTQCQLAHWKDHKVRCKLTRAGGGRMKDLMSKRKARLLQEWRDLARNGLMPLVLTSSMRRDELEQQPAKVCALLQVDFDYNFKTFMPVDKPVVGPIPDHMASVVRAKPPQPGNYVHLVVLQIGDRDAIAMPTGMCPESLNYKPPGGWEGLMDVFRNVKLTSSAFDTWMPILQNNLKQQTDLFRSSEAWVEFLFAALHMNTSSPLHGSHIVIIEVELGFGLGELRSLTNFEVTAVDKFLQLLQKDGTPAAAIDRYRANEFDLSPSSPLLKQAAPGSVYLPVVFFRRSAVMLVQPNAVAYSGPPPAADAIRKSKSDNLARAGFRQLQASLAAAPNRSVASPPL